MKRKINLVGTGTLTISLPSEWVKYHGLKKGDHIELVDEGNKLSIYADKTLPTKEIIKIDAYGPKRSIRLLVGNVYRKGFNEIEMRYEDSRVMGYINENLYYLTGFDIVEQDTHHTILKNVANIDDNEFDNTLRRMFLTTISLAKESYKAIKEKKFEDLKSIMKLEATQNKQYMFCSRVVNIAGHKKFKKPSIIYLFLHRLENVADFYKLICDYISKSEEKKMTVSKETLELYKKTTLMVERVYDLYYKYSQQKDGVLWQMKEDIIKKGHELLEKVPKKEIRIVHLLIETASAIYECTSPIHGLYLE